MKHYLLISFSALAALALSGCSVGPNYHRPAPLPAQSAPNTFGDGSTNAVVWKVAAPSAAVPRGEWWKIFADPKLNRLENLAQTNNQNLAAAIARLEQARELA